MQYNVIPCTAYSKCIIELIVSFFNVLINFKSCCKQIFFVVFKKFNETNSSFNIAYLKSKSCQILFEKKNDLR